MQKKTKIVATIGPSSEDAETLTKLHEAGLNIIRLNFSHGDYGEHGVKVDRWNAILEDSGDYGAVMADLAGPEIRTGDIPEPLTFAVGDTLHLIEGGEVATEDTFYINYPDLPGDVTAGDRILIDDGRIAMKVVGIDGDIVTGEVTQGGIITSGGRGVNVPGVDLSLPSLTEKDLADLEFAVEKEVDFVAISFVKTAADIELLREKLAEHDAEDTKIVAKIETQAAVDNLDEIIAATDCMMVARGDLAVEVDLENVPIIQKQIIQKCNAVGVPVITATQMLESMTEASTPTRAEASDVANAILDGSDAVMLSGETAMGDNPVESVSVMARIAEKMEKQQEATNRNEIEKPHTKPVDAVTASVVRVAEDISAQAIVALTDSGLTPRMISRYRPKQDIFAFSAFKGVCRQLSISYGVQPNFMAEANDTEAAIVKLNEFFANHPDFQSGDKIIIAAGVSESAKKLGTNSLLIVEL